MEPWQHRHLHNGLAIPILGRRLLWKKDREVIVKGLWSGVARRRCLLLPVIITSRIINLFLLSLIFLWSFYTIIWFCSLHIRIWYRDWRLYRVMHRTNLYILPRVYFIIFILRLNSHLIAVIYVSVFNIVDLYSWQSTQVEKNEGFNLFITLTMLGEVMILYKLIDQFTIYTMYKVHTTDLI